MCPAKRAEPATSLWRYHSTASRSHAETCENVVCAPWHAACVTPRVRSGASWPRSCLQSASLLLLPVLAGCGMRQLPTREPVLPELEPPAPTYNSRIVALRTSLGRAAINLELRGTRESIRGSACDVPVAQRVQAGCVECKLAGEGDALDSATLDAIREAFDRYPNSVLEGTQIEKVALCTELAYNDIPNADPAIGTVDLSERRLFISVAPFLHREYDATAEVTAEDIVHHELFHLLEYQRMRDEFTDDPEWRLHNPLGFAYDRNGAAEPRKPGFINAYASSNELEDRASVYQYLLARPSDLCAIAADDAVVRSKTRLVWKRVAALVGDRFLRARASCASTWIDDEEPTPSRGSPSRSVFSFR